MMRTLLVRGMLAGLAAGLLAWLFAYMVGEPAVGSAVAYQDMAAAAAGETEEPMVSRGVQSTLGLGVGIVLYGVVIGGFFALVYATVYGRIGRLSPRATSAVLAATAFVVITVVPFLKYPSNPPGSSTEESIGVRTGTYVLMVLASFAVAVVAVVLGRKLVARFGTWNGALLAVAGYAVVIGIIGAVLPTIAETPRDFPATVLYGFRVATLGTHLVVWGVLGLLFGALVDGRARRERRALVESG